MASSTSVVAYDGALCPAAAEMITEARKEVFAQAGWTGVASMCFAVLVRSLMADGRASEEDVISGIASALANVHPSMSADEADHVGEEIGSEIARQLLGMRGHYGVVGHA